MITFILYVQINVIFHYDQLLTEPICYRWQVIYCVVTVTIQYYYQKCYSIFMFCCSTTFVVLFLFKRFTGKLHHLTC